MLVLAGAGASRLAGLNTSADVRAAGVAADAAAPPHVDPRFDPPATQIGINLLSLDTFSRQQVFANMFLQSYWFVSTESGWKPFPAGQLDRLGWVRRLEPGQTAPHLLVLPPAPFRPVTVRCTFAGKGELRADGAARLRSSDAQAIVLDLAPTGRDDEAAWIELVRTDPADPLRDIDCRKEGTPPEARFDPEIVGFLKGFKVVRFLDWQAINDNPAVSWSDRPLPQGATQVGPLGASIEDMIDLANTAGVDPWFLMPYTADPEYVRAFARLVRARLDPGRKVYVELGNEVWNDVFAVSHQAQSEGMALGLGAGDPFRARMERYAERMVAAMRIWTEVYADRPSALVRVCASINASADVGEMILSFRDTAQWVDAFATAPYLWLDANGYAAGDADRVFAQMPGVIAQTMDMAEANRALAARYGKRFITYEAGQHILTRNVELARAVQCDRRMGEVYRAYLDAWRRRFGDTMVLYGSTGPISQYGSWGLREYAGQPLAETPKLAAVRRFLETAR